MNIRDTKLDQDKERNDRASVKVAAVPLIASIVDSNNLTLSEAQEILDEAVRRYSTLEIETMLTCFTPDIQVNYGNDEPYSGLENLREYLVSRYGALTDFEISKTARCVTGNTIGVEATIKYTNVNEGRKYQGRVFEFLQIKNGLISAWDNVALYWNPEEVK